MKNIIMLSFILLVSQSFGQKTFSLESKIPSSSNMVIRINGGELTGKVGMKNIAKSQAFLKLLEGEIFLGNDKKRVTEIGINLKRNVYMFSNSNENMTYTAYMYHIEKPKLFAKYIAEKNEFVETQLNEKYSVIFYKSTSYYDDTQDFLAWNNDFAIYVDVSYTRDKPEPEDTDRTENIRDAELNDPADTQVTEAAMDAMEAVEEAADAAEDAVEAPVEVEIVEIEEYEVLDVAPPPVPKSNNPFGNGSGSGQGEGTGNANSSNYYQEREAQRVARQKTRDSLREVERIEKLKFVRTIYATELDYFFGGSVNTENISTNQSYIKSKNVKSDVGVWMNLDSSPIRSRSMYSYRRYGRRDNLPGMLTTFLGAYAGKDLNANLFFNKNDISIQSNVEFLPQISSLLAGVYGTSIPKGYLKYISNQDVLGISSISMNSAKFWEAFPKVLSEAMIMESRKKPREEELAGIRVLVDFASIMMDEEALSKLVTGNAVFVLKDLVPTEVEYYSYEYDQDTYTSKKVKKTKTEIYPDFLLMFGSKNKDFMTKLLGLACKNNVLYKNGNYYYTDGKSRDFPFVLYFTLTNDMAFVSTNSDEIKNLAAGKTTGKLDKQLASNLLKNTSYMNLNLAELLSRIPEEKMSTRELKMLTYFKDNGGEIEWFNNYEENKSKSEMKMNTPVRFKNSALFIWDLIETAEQF